MRYRLGLPAWAFTGWQGHFFDNQPSALASYARVFNTVEGNTTFYSTPDKNTVDQWQRTVTDSDFQFCFKLPREVTHQQHADIALLETFCRRIKPLGANLGPLLVQFPATTGPVQLNTIEQVLSHLPSNFRVVLEVRHLDFFRQPETLRPLLEKFRAGLAVMDTRAVFQGDRHHPEVRAALHDKPDVPVWNQVFNGVLFVRLLLHPDKSSNESYLQQWVNRTAKALSHGCEVFMMIHCPNNQHCPEMALEFHNRLRRQVTILPMLVPWPVPQQASFL